MGGGQAPLGKKPLVAGGLPRRTVVNAGAPPNRPVINTSPSRRSEESADAGRKRRSVEAARAGEYFAHILREYPMEPVKASAFLWVFVRLIH